MSDELAPMPMELVFLLRRSLRHVNSKAEVCNVVLRCPGYRVWIYRFRDGTRKHPVGEWKAARDK